MTNLSVIILTKNEKLHIKRCLEKLAPLEPRQIFIVDCFSTDESDKIAIKMGATVVQREWPGLYAKQFNWALDNLPIKASWVLRLDADEYLTEGTIERLKVELPTLSEDVAGLRIELKRRFMGGEIRHGTSGIMLLRVFRYGVGRCEERAMDEHIQLGKGRCIDFGGAFYDDNLNSFGWWQEKHRGYAKREAMDAISLFSNHERLKNPSTTDKKKIKYYKLPPYFRAFVYFCYRYFFRLGFLDGYAGWMWHFWQGLWYRCLVDQEISRLKRRSALSLVDCCLWTLSMPFSFIQKKAGKLSSNAESKSDSGRLVMFHIVKTLAGEYGGPARAVQGLCAALEEAGMEVHLIAIESCKNPWVGGVTHYHCLDAAGYRDVYEKMCKLIDVYRPNIIHTHDCWMPILNMCHRAARDNGVPYVISPHGSLKRWSRRQKWLKKWIALKTYEGYDIRHAVALHVTADDEREQVAELKMNKNIIQVTNGLVFPDVNMLEELRQERPTKSRKRALFLSRIHYTKGLINLVEAWARVVDCRQSLVDGDCEWELEIVGTDADGYQAEVEKRVRELGIESKVIFHGPASDEDKWAEYVGADLFVHPTFTENFGIVIAEALYAGLPVITTKGAPWPELEGEKCGWWIDIGVDPLVEALRKAFATPAEELRRMGMSGRKIVERKCSWSALGKKLKAEYERVLEGKR